MEITNGTKYCENASRLRVFVPRTGARLVGMGLPRAAWVKLNRLWTCWAIPFVHAQMGSPPLPNCECGASEQTADHVLTVYHILHRAPHGARDLTVLDDETRCWLNNTTASI